MGSWNAEVGVRKWEVGMRKLERNRKEQRAKREGKVRRWNEGKSEVGMRNAGVRMWIL